MKTKIEIYPKLEENSFILNQKELFCERLPYPIAKSYFCMLNSNGQRRFSYFLETFELALRFYYFVLTILSNQKITKQKLSLGQLLFFSRKMAERQSETIEASDFCSAFRDNYHCFQKLVRLRNRNWAHGLVKQEVDYDLKYLTNLHFLNAILLPFLEWTSNYFVVKEVICFREGKVLVSGWEFLGANSFPRRKLFCLPYDFNLVQVGAVYLRLGLKFLDLSDFIFFQFCEVCHLDSCFVFQDYFKNRKHLTAVFLCVNCGARGVKTIS